MVNKFYAFKFTKEMKDGKRVAWLIAGCEIAARIFGFKFSFVEIKQPTDGES